MINGQPRKIIWYLAKPRKLPGSGGIREFSYKKSSAPSKCMNTPDALIVAWDIFYNDSFIIKVGTLKEVKAFIKEKLET